jgi:hypothetical protein
MHIDATRTSRRVAGSASKPGAAPQPSRCLAN